MVLPRVACVFSAFARFREICAYTFASEHAPALVQAVCFCTCASRLPLARLALAAIFIFCTHHIRTCTLVLPASFRLAAALAAMSRTFSRWTSWHSAHDVLRSVRRVARSSRGHTRRAAPLRFCPCRCALTHAVLHLRLTSIFMRHLRCAAIPHRRRTYVCWFALLRRRRVSRTFSCANRHNARRFNACSDRWRWT